MCKCGEVEQLKQDYDEIDTALMEVAEDQSQLKKANATLRVDRDALVRYVVMLQEQWEPLNAVRDEPEWLALSQELRDEINLQPQT